jgi:hypothetical protein
MNLTTYQLTAIIADAEIRLVNLMKQVTELEPQTKEYYAAYINLKEQLDDVRKKVEENKELIEKASAEKNGIATGKQFRVLRAESHNDMKEKEKRKYATRKYTWTDWGIEILKEMNCFITTDQLWDAVCQKHEVPTGRGSGNSKLKWGAVHNCWLKTPKMFVHKEKIGLIDWKEELHRFKVAL